jgi:hypothetical protein
MLLYPLVTPVTAAIFLGDPLAIICPLTGRLVPGGKGLCFSPWHAQAGGLKVMVTACTAMASDPWQCSLWSEVGEVLLLLLPC